MQVHLSGGCGSCFNPDAGCGAVAERERVGGQICKLDCQNDLDDDLYHHQSSARQRSCTLLVLDGTFFGLHRLWRRW